MPPLSALIASLAFSLALAGAVLAQSGVDQTQANNSVRAVLAKEGDNGTVPRPVRHWAYPVSANHTSLRQVKKSIRKMGFAVENATGGGVEFNHLASVTGTDFDALTTRLTEFFAKIGWEYDGWETVLVRQGE